MDDELKRIWKEVVVSQSKYYPDKRLEGPRTAGVPAGVRTGDLPNTSRNANLFCCLVSRQIRKYNSWMSESETC
jgi:hypothetical protein